MMAKTQKLDMAVEIFVAYVEGRISAEQGLLQLVLRNLQPSQQKAYSYVLTYAGLTSKELARYCGWSDAMASTTLKVLIDARVVSRRSAQDKGSGSRYYRYYAKGN